MRMDYRLDPPEGPDDGPFDPDCGKCLGYGRYTDEDEDGKHSVRCDCDTRDVEEEDE
jgi:hypothetical protein